MISTPQHIEEKQIALRNDAEPIIEVAHLQKAFGDNEVLKDFNLKVYPAENVVVMGKSGIGKTVLIKCIIGLIKPDAGTLRVFGEDIIVMKQKELDDLRMRIGFVFQSSALYDSMTVRENLEFPLRRKHHITVKINIEEKIREVLRNVGLEHTIDLMPSELSGGMRKRIGIARSLVLDPEIVLYDEPTTGLDPITSREITDLILDVQKKYNTASIIITHDVELARRVSSHIVFLSDGIAYAEGKYEDIIKIEDPDVKPFFER